MSQQTVCKRRTDKLSPCAAAGVCAGAWPTPAGSTRPIKRSFDGYRQERRGGGASLCRGQHAAIARARRGQSHRGGAAWVPAENRAPLGL